MVHNLKNYKGCNASIQFTPEPDQPYVSNCGLKNSSFSFKVRRKFVFYRTLAYDNDGAAANDEIADVRPQWKAANDAKGKRWR